MSVLHTRGLYLAVLSNSRRLPSLWTIFNDKRELSLTIAQEAESRDGLRFRFVAFNFCLPPAALRSGRVDTLQRYAKIKRQVGLHVVMREAGSRNLNYV